MSSREGSGILDSLDVGIGSESTPESLFWYLKNFQKGDRISVSLKNGKSISGKYVRHTRGRVIIKGRFFTRIISLRIVAGVSSFHPISI